MTAPSRAAFCLLAAAIAAGAAEPLPNPSFELGQHSPAGWRLEGKGTWEKTGHVGQRSARVEGTGDDSSYWRTTDYAFEPDTLYRVSFWTQADRAAAGCVIAGPSFCNRDFGAQPGWQRHAFAFITPASVADACLRFGQWHVAGKVAFDDVELKPTQAVHEHFGAIALGEGEEILGDRYIFSAPLAAEGANHSRPLHAFRCGFNSNRWCFHDGAEVVYRFAIPAHEQRAATIEANCNYHQSGAGFIDASTDGQEWTNVARFDKVSPIRADVPKKLLPADTLYVRLRAAGKETDARDSKPGDFQINELRYLATLDADLGEMRGATAYLDIQLASQGFPVTVLALPSASGAETSGWKVKIENRTGAPGNFQIATSVETEKGKEEPSRISASVSAGATMQFSFAAPLRQAGDNTVSLTIASDGVEIYKASARRHVPSLHDAAYGYILASSPACDLWWCEGTHKVSRTRALPAAKGPRVELAAARNEFEPVQLVLRPRAELRNVRVDAAPLTGSEGAIAADHIRVHRVAYVRVARPTDSAGVRGWWPDPLPPFEQGSDLEAGRNHPLWITVHVPSGQPAGEYRGSVLLKADGWAAEVPILLRVWDFELPRTASLQTGFGLSPGIIRRYHNLQTGQELRQVLDLYLKSFAAHRIAPYTPAMLDPYKVEFSTGPWDGGTIDTKDPKEGKRCLRIDDNDPKSSVVAFHTKPIAVDTKKQYRLTWSAKAAKPKQQYLVTLQQYDAAGQWLSGNNMDFPGEGTGEWKHEMVELPQPGGMPFNRLTRSLRLALRPAPWSDAGEATGTAWFDDIEFCVLRRETHQIGEVREIALEPGPNLLEDGGFERVAGELKATIDFAAFDRECEKWLGEGGFNALSIPLRGLGGGTFHARHPGRIGSSEQGSPEYEKLMASQGRQLVDHLRAKGWLERAYIYWFDEPDPKDYEFVVEGMKTIKRAAPGLTRMLTEQPEPALFGHVDLWCPVLSSYDPKVGAERQRAGDRFWWYLCCGPRAPYIGLFIDHPAVDLRVWAWLSRKWGITGQLVWTSNYWTSPAAFPPPDIQNPWDDPMSYVSGYSYQPGQIGYWGNGDGRFLYPPNRDPKSDAKKHLGGPIPSIRWEMLREGMEDYEYFVLLDRLIAQARKTGKAAQLVAQAERLAVVPDAVITDGKTYSKDPAPLLAHRRQVAEMVEKLARALK